MEKEVRVNLKQLIKKHNISLRELSRLADIRHSALSELANNKRQNINMGHIKRIAEALDIDDIQEIIEIINTKE
ncbi:helix-turn-helix transcriptional regulator [Mesobacillus sp. AQ2]|uniref:helix-turn-helix domain-containing protein n=1 Tax=Mesobacillus sp. AQ2 TaxID=3043332 RepID=UPI0024C11C4B|nr:helix-turn-helix transcriptional regulator [Mesobacillus sp. AQ2]WHX41175.1 helix-turn-helix transcriptional regulator [Mesobacillus sp. AQ2]